MEIVTVFYIVSAENNYVAMNEWMQPLKLKAPKI